MVRLFLLCAGSCCVGLGVIGIFLPILPTTPFLLLAAACYARSSERIHQKLLDSPVLGDIIYQWETHRSIPRRARNLALLMITVCFSVSILFVIPIPLVQGAMLAIGVCIFWFILRLPVRDCEAVVRGEPL
mgnify:CR=1 FL=1